MTVLNDLGKFGRHAFGKRWLWPFLYTFLTLTKRTAEQRTSHNLASYTSFKNAHYVGEGSHPP